ncbi:DsbE family thiol:disulfide interchange protein [Rhodovulum imhoffii]|nr:DsbE family thiol:disulfide interchange protein [Rhodovulum imhoffii]MBK5933103.1 thiol:disulfide interchange protein [Rhodovulum imhoffii]
MALPPLIFAALAAVFYIGVMREDPEALPSTLEGKPAPALMVTQLGENAPFTDADLRSGKVVLVNFWASWCVPCRIEHAVLSDLAAEGLTIYGIAYKDKATDSLKFLAELGNPFAALAADETGRTGIEWGVYGVPETYVVAEDGTIVLRHAGPLTQQIVAEKLRPAMENAAR